MSQQQRLSGRQAHEAELLKRFLDAKNRTIGLDLPALAAQRAAKAAALRAEKEENRIEAYQTAAAAAAVEEIEYMMREEVKQQKRNITHVWDTQLDKTQRDSWDLENPRALHDSTLPRSTLPCYVTGEVGHASNAQILREAETKEDPRVIKLKQHALWSGLQHQEIEKQNEKWIDARASAAQDWALTTMGNVIHDLESLTAAEKKAQTVLIARENQVFAQARGMLKQAEKQHSEEISAAAKRSVLADSMMRQDVRTGYWASDPTRKRPDEYRGMLEGEARKIREANQHEMLKRAYDKEEEKKRKLAEEAAEATLTATAGLIQKTEAIEVAARNREYYEELRQTALAKQAAKKAEVEWNRKNPPLGANGGLLSGFGSSLR